jgi:hypothetical protein
VTSWAQKWLVWCENEGSDISAELTVWQLVPFVGLRVGGLWQRSSAHSSQNRDNKTTKAINRRPVDRRKGPASRHGHERNILNGCKCFAVCKKDQGTVQYRCDGRPGKPIGRFAASTIWSIAYDWPVGWDWRQRYRIRCVIVVIFELISIARLFFWSSSVPQQSPVGGGGNGPSS